MAGEMQVWKWKERSGLELQIVESSYRERMGSLGEKGKKRDEDLRHMDINGTG